MENKFKALQRLNPVPVAKTAVKNIAAGINHFPLKLRVGAALKAKFTAAPEEIIIKEEIDFEIN